MRLRLREILEVFFVLFFVFPNREYAWFKDASKKKIHLGSEMVGKHWLYVNSYTVGTICYSFCSLDKQDCIWHIIDTQQMFVEWLNIGLSIVIMARLSFGDILVQTRATTLGGAGNVYLEQVGPGFSASPVEDKRIFSP